MGLLFAIGGIGQALQVLRWLSTLHLIQTGILAGLKVLTILACCRLWSDTLSGAVGGLESQVEAFESNINTAFKGTASALDGNKPMQDIDDIPNFVV